MTIPVTIGWFELQIYYIRSSYLAYKAIHKALKIYSIWRKKLSFLTELLSEKQNPSQE